MGVVLYHIAFQKDFKPRILYLTCIFVIQLAIKPGYFTTVCYIAI